MADWRFYGRKAEMERVNEVFEWPKFNGLKVLGRRGIGKSELLAEANRRAEGHPPVMMFELPVPGLMDQDAINRSLLDRIRQSLPSGTLDDLGEPSPYNLPHQRFAEIVEHLLFKNVVVALDEFHHAKGLFLESEIKQMIDRARSIGGPHPPGKLFVMGSHQQQFLAMFRGDQPLFGRFHSAINLKQWRVPTALEMAEEQGFLRHPGRFLTLWTAFGGIPRHWEAFASSDQNADALRDFSSWQDDKSWLQSFVEWQRGRLEGDPEERFDNRSFIELAAPHRDALLWLGLHEPRGAMIREFPADLRNQTDPPLKESLDVLRKHLQLVDYRGEFYGKGDGRWGVADNNTLFQIAMFPDLFESDSLPVRALASGTQRQPADRLRTLEGLALERLAAAWLGSLPDMVNSMQGVWRNRHNPPFTSDDGTPLPPLPDIDVLGLKGKMSDADPILFLGGCKRNPRRHDPSALDRQFAEILADLGDQGERARKIQDMRKEKFLVSPGFTAAQRKRFAESGYVCVDIPGMRIMTTEKVQEPGLSPMQLILLADRRQIKQVQPAAGSGKDVPDPDDTRGPGGASGGET